MDSFSLAGLEGLIGDAIRELPAERAGLTVSSQVTSPKHWVWVAIDLKCADFIAHPVRFFQTVAGAKPQEIVDPEDPPLRLLRRPIRFDSRVEFRSQTITSLGASPGSQSSSRSCSSVDPHR